MSAARNDAVFAADAVRYLYRGYHDEALHDVTMHVDAGDLYAIIGPNGSGKSTLLRVLLGALQPAQGSALFLGRSVESWDRRELARRIGVVPQVEETMFPIVVRDLVAMGRYPHLGAFRSEGPEDREAIETALQRCDVAHLAARLVTNLSGGERQRVRIARALAQRPQVLVLDEPTAALDIGHEMTVFELLSEFQRDGVTVVLATHNLNLAARYASRVLLLDRGRVVAEDVATVVFERARIEASYRWPVAIYPHPGPGADRGAPQVTPLAKLPSPDRPS